MHCSTHTCGLTCCHMRKAYQCQRQTAAEYQAMPTALGPAKQGKAGTRMLLNSALSQLLGTDEQPLRQMSSAVRGVLRRRILQAMPGKAAQGDSCTFFAWQKWI